MKEYPKYVAGSPFDKAQKAALEFAIRLHEEVIFKNEIGRVRDIEVNSEGEIFLIADELDSNLFILKP